MSEKIVVPVSLVRGGTSKGVFIDTKELPEDVQLRDKYLLAIMGSPDPRQIDGLGGAHSLTSKVGIISKSTDEHSELTFLFAQLQPNSDVVDTEPNCGNMLAAVVPFAIENKLIEPKGDITTVRVLTANTGMLSDITVETPKGEVRYDGDARIDGVPGTASPIYIKFLDIAGSLCGSLLPTGSAKDTFTLSNGKTVDVTCIDNGMPMVLMNAQDFGVTGYESVADYNANTELKAEINRLRLEAAIQMGLGDVSQKNYPKMCLLAPAIDGGAIHTRCYIPHMCHDAIGVLAAVTVATACVHPESIAHPLATLKNHGGDVFSIEHPTGEFSVSLDVEEDAGSFVVKGASLLRTARVLMKGEAYVSPKKINGQ